MEMQSLEMTLTLAQLAHFFMFSSSRKNNNKIITKYNFNKKNWLMGKSFNLANLKSLLVII
jgi:hypothetical protein